MGISAQDDVLSVIENGNTFSAGNLLSNDSSPEGGLTVTAVGGSSGNVNSYVYGTYGYIRINTDGSYTYTLSNGTSTNSLAAGNIGRDNFVYTVRNAAGEQSLATLRVSVTGINDTPVAVSDTASPSSSGSYQSSSVLYNDSDVDNGDALTVTNVNGFAPGTVTGKYGILRIASNGVYSYTLASNAGENRLHEGETSTDVFNYTVTDSQGGTAYSMLNVAVRGSDPAPVFVVQNHTSLPLGTGQNYVSGVATAQLSSAQTLVITNESVASGSGFSIKAQVTDASGNPVGASFLVQSSASGYPGSINATELTSGRVVAVWGAGTASESTAFQIFDAAGSPLGQSVTLTKVDQYPASMQAKATALTDGSFVISWIEYGSVNNNGQYSQTAINRFQMFDSLGQATSGKQTLSAAVANGSAATLVASPDGGFTAAWFGGQSGANQPKPIEVQAYSSTGQQAGREATIGFASASAHSIGMVTLSDGKLLTYWQDSYGEVFGQTYDRNTNVLTSAFRVVGDAVGSENDLSLTATANGGFVGVYKASIGSNSAIDLGAQSLRAQVFDGLGNRVSGSFEIRSQSAPMTYSTIGRIVTEPRADGSITTSWTENTYDQSTGRNTYTLISKAVSYDSAPNYLLGNNEANLLTGNNLANTLVGFGGNDILDGRAGVDRMEGGAGNDIYHIDNVDDLVVELAGGGFDRILSSVSLTLAAGVEVEMLTTDWNPGLDPINFTGNEIANAIYGNAGMNVLHGGAGNDSLIGFEGDDQLSGDSGADDLFGGTGNDWYFVDGSDRVFENAGAGFDRVFASTSFRLTAGASVEMLTTDFNPGISPIDLTGNEFAQAIFGNAGNNRLTGGGGNDTLVGFEGNDNYFVDNANVYVVEAVGGGTDRVYASASYALAAGSEIEVLSTDFNAGTAAIALTGNEFANGIYGNAGSNLLRGGDGNDTLIGFEGSDSLDGGSGADDMYGGVGHDWYYVDNAADRVIENAGEGSDRIFASVSYRLAVGVSVEVLSTDFNAGTDAINLTGNELGQTIYGNEGANVLDGGAGADNLTGFGGADYFAFSTTLGAGNVDILGDFVSGTDRVQLSQSIFAGLSFGNLSVGAFVAGTQAQDADDRIIYDQARGALYFDADGSGMGAAVQFAQLNAGAALTATDFWIV